MIRKQLDLLPLLLLLLLLSPSSALLSSSSSSSVDLPTASGVAAAYEEFVASSSSLPVVRTPLLESPLLNQELDCRRLLIKAECLQRTGSFKFRGALNRLINLNDDDDESAKQGVLAFSSGNFGQALAAAATSLKIPCCIVSPHDAPAIKLERIEKFGANLVLSTAKEGENREVIASALAREISETQGMTLLHPFEDANVIHGQGTCGMELLEQSYDLLDDNYPDVIIVPCGGGGLTAGINLAVEHEKANSQVYTVEPKGFDDHAQSFVAKKRLSLADIYSTTIPKDRSVFCDALMAGAPGEITWNINGPRLAGALESLGDDSAARAMKVAFDHFRLVLEPSGALGLAAVLDKQLDLTDKTVVVVASGGNTDLETFSKLMGSIAM